MDWQEQLISIYLYICKHYEHNLWVYCERMSNYVDLSFSDEEVITLYLFGIIDKKTTIKSIYEYADRHLREWFPELPGYVAFVQRLNRLSGVFGPLLRIIQKEQEQVITENKQAMLIDSFPVALARQGHRFKACVAKGLVGNGYCPAKKMYFYGMRVHVVARRQPGSLPSPEHIIVTPASESDGKVFDQILPKLFNEIIFADKAYQRPEIEGYQKEHNIKVFTPVKKKKGQKYLEADEKLLSTAVSKVRQPIETLFGWIEEKTGIEIAGKVRSYKGLLVHIFGRMAAAMFFWNKLRPCS
jgi:hypothetical protein